MRALKLLAGVAAALLVHLAGTQLFGGFGRFLDVFLVVVVIYALEGETLSAIFVGLFVGLLHDTLTGGPFGLFGFADTIVGYGTGVQQALGAAELLAEGGLDVTVADARFAKPLDTGLLAQLAAEHDLLVTIEEGVLAGGFGTGVWEVLSEGGLTPRILRVGLPDRYVTHGAPALLHAEVGYTPERIAERIQSAVLEGRGTFASA